MSEAPIDLCQESGNHGMKAERTCLVNVMTAKGHKSSVKRL